MENVVHFHILFSLLGGTHCSYMSRIITPFLFCTTDECGETCSLPAFYLSSALPFVYRHVGFYLNRFGFCVLSSLIVNNALSLSEVSSFR